MAEGKGGAAEGEGRIRLKGVVGGKMKGEDEGATEGFGEIKLDRREVDDEAEAEEDAALEIEARSIEPNKIFFAGSSFNACITLTNASS